MDEQIASMSFIVSEHHTLDANIHRIILEPETGVVPVYHAGQYLEVILENGQKCAFSIASPPGEQQESLELHIQRLPGNKNSDQLFLELKSGVLNLKLPQGKCFLPEKLPDQPLLLIAAGTGFAQMKSMVEICFAKQHEHDIHLYWGARTPTDFYLPHLPVQWSAKGLHYHPVVSDADSDGDWCGRHGLLYEAILADREQLMNASVYLSGSPQMVYATVDAMIEAGFPSGNLHSDVFDYAPRQG